MCRVGKGRFLAVPTVNAAVGTAKKRPLPTLHFNRLFPDPYEV